MNYPSTLSNPMLKRKSDRVDYDSIGFSNLNRPLWAPSERVKRPITAITEKGKRIGKPLPITHNYYQQTKEELLHIVDSDQDSQDECVKKPQISNFETTKEAYNLPSYYAPLPIQPHMTAHEAKKQLDGKETNSVVPQSLGFDYSKRSSGTLTTTLHEERQKLVNVLNKKSQYISPLKPLSAYWGKKLGNDKDPFDRRKVKQLDDISFESDTEPEEIKDHRRMPETVLTEENLKNQLTPTLKALNLDNHSWLHNNFINKIGRMAPNIVELSIRGLKVSSEAFIDMVKHMGLLKIIDISYCTNLEEKAIINLVDKNIAIVRFKAAGWAKAITDVSLKHFVGKSRTQLEILDISYCTQLTDDGLSGFQEINETQMFHELYLNGLTQVTNKGFASILSTCSGTLKLLHMGLNDQFEVNGGVCKSIAKCFELEILDLTGCKNISDDGINNLCTGSIPGEEKPIIVGLKNLRILKLNHLDLINDSGLIRLLKTSDQVTHLEVSTCISLTEYFFSQIKQVAPSLQFIDMNLIVSMVPKLFDEFKEQNPSLNIRMFQHQMVDPKDNGLRRPLKIKGKKPKKGKKKKGKKKKK